jgi:hypothetical protein
MDPNKYYIAIRPLPSLTQFAYDLEKRIWCLFCKRLAHVTYSIEVNAQGITHSAWHWYECVTCGRIDFYDSAWDNEVDYSLWRLRMT